LLNLTVYKVGNFHGRSLKGIGSGILKVLQSRLKMSYLVLFAGFLMAAWAVSFELMM